MTIASGIGSQCGIKLESTLGTRVVVDRFFEFTEESLTFKRNFATSKGIRANRHTARRRYPLDGWVEGDLKFELAPQSTAIVFKMGLGTDTVTGSNPYTHTFTHSVLDAVGATIQINRPDVTGTDRPFDFVGCQATNVTIEAKAGEVVMCTMSVYGQYVDTAQSLASASYPTSWTPYTFVHGALTLAGSSYEVKDISIDIPTGIATGRHRIRATNPERPKASLSQNTRMIGGKLTSDLFDLTQYAKFGAQTASSLSLVFTSGTNVLTISGNVEFEQPDGPTVKGEDILELGIPFTFLHATADASAFSVVLVNADSAT